MVFLWAKVSKFCPGLKPLAPFSGRLRRPARLPDIIFSDRGSFPSGPDSAGYWATWTAPHLFFDLGVDASGGGSETKLQEGPDQVTDAVAQLWSPPGWTVRSVCLSHAETGGGTSGRWTFFIWYPPGHPWCEPAIWEPRNGTPLLCCVNDRVRSTPHLGTRPVREVGVRVEWVDGLAMDSGLFPASSPSARVLVESSGSPTGYGSWVLSAHELGDLWDVPILFLDALRDEEVMALMRGLWRTPPSWLLHTGADVLLTAGFRGGSTGRDQSAARRLPGPRPRTDTELGILPDMKQQRRDAVLNVQAAAAEAAVGLACSANEVIKGDTQKADNAAVPDQLWLRAFVLGYGKDATSLRQHLDALKFKAGGTTVLKNPPAGEDPHAGWLLHNKPPMGWRGSLAGFRIFGLRHWRRLVTQGYQRWRAANVRLPLTNPSALVQYRMEWRSGVTQPVYAWTRAGRQSYRAEWRAMRATTDGKATVEAGLDAIFRCADATWFEWPKGSAILFWNWGPEYQREVRDGQPHFMTRALETPFLRKQAKARDAEQHELMRAKVVQVRQRGYISTGEVVSGTHYFCVTKGTTDIRMVYNGTSCGLNACLHAPRYGLLQVKHTLRALREGYYQCDLDVGEQFLNYKLHDNLRQLSGVDIREVRSRDPVDESWEVSRPGNWERWERNWMGLRDSPYRSLQWQVRLKIEVYGDRHDRTNPFHWEKVVMNLPGSTGYRASLPWVMKVRWDGELAAEVFVYVDDGRPTGPTEYLAWQAARAYGAGCTRRGVQDASRKRTSPSQTPGPWAGTVTHTDQGRICGTVSQEKWEKTKRLIAEMATMMECKHLPLGRLLQIRGFMMYVVRTYPWINPYMKGLHLTIDSWRPFRGADGFKLRGKELENALACGVDDGLPCRRNDDDDNEPPRDTVAGEGGEPPMEVKPVPRFLDDLVYLQDLVKPETPPRQLYCAKHPSALFVIGDASGKAKGAVVVTQFGLDYESGVWSQLWRKKSSNVREAENLTDRLERLASDVGRNVAERVEELNTTQALADHEVFVLTDNSAFEGAYYKGHSTSKELSDIVFRLYKAQRDGGLILHVLHISGKRMKASGVDGLSRGDHTEGMMGGEDPMSYLPFHLGADTRSQGRVGKWIRSWWRMEDRAVGQGLGQDWGNLPLEEIGSDNMFELKDVKAARLWMLPPAAMEVAIELLWEDRLAHPQWPHVFCVPRLMTHMWRRDLGKNADILFVVPVGVPFWGADQFEPLIVVIVFPLAHVRNYTGPWEIKGTDLGLRYEHALGEGFKRSGTRPGRGSEGGGGKARGTEGCAGDPGQLHVMDGPLPGVFDDPEAGSRALLRELLAEAGKFPPVQGCLVREVLPRGGERQLPQAGRPPKRLRSGGGPHLYTEPVPLRPGGRPPDGCPL